MRIVQFVESLDRGGLERVACDLALEQHRLGDKVLVACLFHGGALAGELRAAGIEVHELGKRRGLDPYAMLRLRRLVRSSRAQVVHTHNPVANYYACAALLASWSPPPVVNTRHNMGALEPWDRRESLFRLSVRRTAHVVMVSSGVMRRFIEGGIVPESKASVVINGIPLDRYCAADSATRASARARLGLNADAFIVGSVGRLAPVKNHRLLLEAVASLGDRAPAMLVALVGDGPLRADLERIAGELGIAHRVRFFGERSDIPAVLPAFDVFALPSLSEGYSIALLEAAASGLATVATRVGGNPEIVRDGVTGLLVGSGASAELAEALLSLALDRNAREAMGAEARRWAVDTISVDAMARAYRAIYDRVVGAD